MERRLWSALLLCSGLCAPLWSADLSSYRGFKFGSTVAAAAKNAGQAPAGAKLVHAQPALIEEMDWQVRSRQIDGKPDSVREGVLSFLDGQLYRIVVTYDRYQVEGMSADDMIGAISASYGLATKPNVEIPYHSNYGDVASVLARWEDPQYSYDLVRTGDKASFAMVLYSKALGSQAQAARTEALRIEALAAPQRAIDEAKRRSEEERVALEKTRAANQSTFKP